MALLVIILLILIYLCERYYTAKLRLRELLYTHLWTMREYLISVAAGGCRVRRHERELFEYLARIGRPAGRELVDRYADQLSRIVSGNTVNIPVLYATADALSAELGLNIRTYTELLLRQYDEIKSAPDAGYGTFLQLKQHADKAVDSILWSPWIYVPFM